MGREACDGDDGARARRAATAAVDRWRNGASGGRSDFQRSRRRVGRGVPVGNRGVVLGGWGSGRPSVGCSAARRDESRPPAPSGSDVRCERGQLDPLAGRVLGERGDGAGRPASRSEGAVEADRGEAGRDRGAARRRVDVDRRGPTSRGLDRHGAPGARSGLGAGSGGAPCGRPGRAGGGPNRADPRATGDSCGSLRATRRRVGHGARARRDRTARRPAAGLRPRGSCPLRPPRLRVDGARLPARSALRPGVDPGRPGGHQPAARI